MTRTRRCLRGAATRFKSSSLSSRVKGNQITKVYSSEGHGQHISLLGWSWSMWPPWRSNGSTTARGIRRASCARSSCRRPSSASPCAWPSSCPVSRRSQRWRWVPGFTQQRSFYPEYSYQPQHMSTQVTEFSNKSFPIHKANSDFVRVGRIHFSLQTTTRSRTGHNAMQTPFCHRQGSVQSASMGEHKIRLERFLLKHLMCQRNPTTEYLRHQHVWGRWGGSPWVLTLPTKHHHKWQAQ